MSLEKPNLTRRPTESINPETAREKFERIKTPEELLSFMTENIAYGFVGKNSKKAYPTDFKKETEDADFKKEVDDIFEKEYYLQTPDELLDSGLGVCWDQTELERHWFSKQNTDYNYKALIMFDPKDPKGGINPHTFLAFEKDKKWCWLEHSFQDFRGIHEYDTLEDLIIDVVKKIHEAESRYTKKPTAEDLKNVKVCEYETPNFGTGPKEFVLPIVDKNHLDLMPKNEKPAIEKETIPPSNDLPTPPPELQMSDEEIQKIKTRDEQQIREVRSSLGLNESEVAEEHSYEKAENFEKGIISLRDKIKTLLTEKKCIIVAQAGKTGSGKTTLANELRRTMEKDKIGMTVVSTDDYYLPDSKELDLEKLHATINKLQNGESVGKLTPTEVILVEGLQTIEDRVVGQKPDLRSYISLPVNKRFAARLARDGKEFLSKLTDTEMTPEFIKTVKKFEEDPSMENVDIVVNNDREDSSAPELYILGDALVYSVPNGINGTIKIEPDRIRFLEQIGIQKK